MKLDLVIVGAGPAGMAAAIAARGLGMDATVLDDQQAPGGQIYRNALDDSRDAILGPDFTAGRELVRRFLECGADYRPMSRVWRVDREGVCFSGSGETRLVRAKHVLLATGAMERPVPTQGWTLPGVMTAGAAQIMLKSGGVVAEEPVFVGSGPLLYLTVAQYLRAGVRPRAVLDTTPRGRRAKALKHGVGAMRGWRYLSKGLGLLTEIGRAGVRILRIDDYSFKGTDRLEAVEYRANGATSVVDCNLAFVHQGVIPAAHASMSTTCAHVWSEPQACWAPDVDDMGRTDIDWLRIAGDCAGIRGAVSAGLAGELAVLGIAADKGLTGVGGLGARTSELRRKLAVDGAARPFLDALYRPRAQFLAPKRDEITICRCELVTRADLRDAVAENCPGPNQFKAFTRAGMGPCQGRICGPIVTAVMASMTGKTPGAIGRYNIRSPFTPVSLAEIAQIKFEGE